MNLSTKEITQCSAKTRKNDAEPNGDDSSNWNVPLNYDVLRIIFKQLNVRDISSSMLVCRNWKTAAIDEYSTRGPYCTLRDLKPPLGTHLFIQVSPQMDYQDLPIKPYFGFLFVRSYCQIRNIAFRFPSSCPVIALCTTGILQNKDERDFVTDSRALFTFFPCIPNVQYHAVTLRKKVTFGSPLVYTLYQLPRVNDSTTSTCCIVLYSFKAKCIVHCAFGLLKSWNHKISSVWGGQMQHMSWMKNSQWKELLAVMIFISGAIKTWSTMIDSNWNTEELIKKKLMSFKEQVKLRKHSVAFLISSTRNMDELRDKITIQLRIFESLFPKIPLVGFTGGSVFGKDLTDPEEKILGGQKIHQTHTANRDEGNILCREFGTTFMILTYG